LRGVKLRFSLVTTVDHWSNLHGQAFHKAVELNLKDVSVSLSDSKQHAVAVAIGI
jgi:phosphopantetheinyl transferase (holo-ACP synthase)